MRDRRREYTPDPSPAALDIWFGAVYVVFAMPKLPEVEEAKALMTEAMEWSVFTWLFRKSTVRKTADRANATLDKLNRSIKSRWSGEVKAAYKQLAAKGRGSDESAPGVDPEIVRFVKGVREVDLAARRARQHAEDLFAEAERQMNTGLAREGCKKAIHQWELDEKAIRRAQSVPSGSKVAS